MTETQADSSAPLDRDADDRDAKPHVARVLVCADAVTRFLLSESRIMESGSMIAVPINGGGLCVKMVSGGGANGLSLSFDDIILMQAVGTLFNAADEEGQKALVTKKDVCMAFLGRWNLKENYKIQEKDMEQVEESIERLRTLSLEINANRQMASYGKNKEGDDGEFKWRMPSMLAMSDCKLTAGNGKVVDGYQIDDLPILLQYARDIGQMMYVPTEIMTLGSSSSAQKSERAKKSKQQGLKHSSSLRRKMLYYMLVELHRIKGKGTLSSDFKTKHGVIRIDSMIEAIGGKKTSKGNRRQYREIADDAKWICDCLKSNGLIFEYEIDGQGKNMKLSIDAVLSLKERDAEIDKAYRKDRKRQRKLNAVRANRRLT